MTEGGRRGFAEHVLRPMGELDALTSEHFLVDASRIVSEAGRHGADGIVLDLSSVNFLDTVGVRALVEVREHARLAQLRFRTVGATPAVRNVIETADVSDHLGL